MVNSQGSRWSRVRVAVGLVLVTLLLVDGYAMYSEWFGWDRGGMHGRNPVQENWDPRTGRGLVLAFPLVVGLAFVVWGWPRIIDRIRVERAAIRDAQVEYERTHSWN